MAFTLRWQDVTQFFWASPVLTICLAVVVVGFGVALYFFWQVLREMRKAHVVMVRMTRELERETRP